MKRNFLYKNKNIIIITGGRSGLAKHLIDILKKKSYPVFSIKKVNFDLSKLNNFFRLIKVIKPIIFKKKVLFINNAFSLGQLTKVGSMSNENIIKTINLNFITPFLFFNFLIKNVKNLGIINMTSGAAFTFNLRLSLYSVTKLAIHKLVNYIKKENLKKNYYLKNFNPGLMNTEMHRILKNKKILKNNIKINNMENVLNRLIKIVDYYFKND
jgi:short-subunit dehydrogenase